VEVGRVTYIQVAEQMQGRPSRRNSVVIAGL